MRFFRKIQILISEFKNGFGKSKTDQESIKFTLRVDSSDQIQIRIFEIHNLSVFLGKDFGKRFFEWYATDAVYVRHSN